MASMLQVVIGSWGQMHISLAAALNDRTKERQSLSDRSTIYG